MTSAWPRSTSLAERDHSFSRGNFGYARAVSEPDDETRLGRPVGPRLVDPTLAPSAAAVGRFARQSADGRYRLDVELGRGGMGRVTRGIDVELGRVVAIKESLDRDPTVLARFQREAAITARLQHPSIVALYDVTRGDDGRPLLVMRLVDGTPLDQLVAATSTLDQRLALLPRVLPAIEAVAYAHRQGVIHRDLKPANILVGELGDTVVIDWGLATVEGEAASASARPLSAPDATAAGTVMGTPGFMAPEQARGDAAGPRADVFALGATLFYTLTGARPFAGDTSEELLVASRDAAARALAAVEAGVPRELAAIVDKALARTADDRYPTAEALVIDLRAFLAGRLVSAHHYSRRQRLARFARRQRLPLSVAAAAVLALAAVGAVAVTRIVGARDRAEAARVDAEAARRRESDRVDELLAIQADGAVAADPARALALLQQRRRRGDAAERAVALAAARANVGSRWKLADQQLSVAVWLGGDQAVLTSSFGRSLTWVDRDGGRREVALPGTGVVDGPLALADGGAVVVRDGVGYRLDARAEVIETWPIGDGLKRIQAAGDVVAWEAADGVQLRLIGARETASVAGSLLDLTARWALVGQDGRVAAVEVASLRRHDLGLAWLTQVSPDGTRALLFRDEEIEEVTIADGQSTRRWPVAAGHYVDYSLGRVLDFSAPSVTALDDPRPIPVPTAGRTLVARGEARAAIGVDHAVVVFDFAGARTIELPERASALAWSADQRGLAVGTADGQLIVIDAEASELVDRGPAEHLLGWSSGGALVSHQDELVLLGQASAWRFRDPAWSLGQYLVGVDGALVVKYVAATHTAVVLRAGQPATSIADVAGVTLRGAQVVTVDPRGQVTAREPSAGSPEALGELGEPGVVVVANLAGDVAAAGASGALWRQRRGGRAERARLARAPQAIQLAPDGALVIVDEQTLAVWPTDGPIRELARLPGRVTDLFAGPPILVTVAGTDVYVVEPGRARLLAHSDVNSGAWPALGAERVLIVAADGGIDAIAPGSGVKVRIPLPAGLIGGLVIDRDGRTVVGVVRSRLWEWRDPSPAEPAAVARWVDELAARAGSSGPAVPGPR
ncbi:MAG: protein kinase [Kofleriaceae bacterium]